MPSAFERLVTAGALPGFYAVFGVAAVYTAPDGTATAVTVRVHRNEVRQVEAPTKDAQQLQTGEILVRQSELPAPHRPVKGGRFQVENVEIWTIENTPTLKNGEFTCAVMRKGTERLMERRAKDA